MGQTVGISLRTIPAPGLAKLAWSASIDQGSVIVTHGGFVEAGTDWFSEGIWDDAFSREGLESAPNLFGSAGRLDESKALFHAATHPIDRILVAESEDTVVVSNSLAVLLAATGADLAGDHDYLDEHFAILEGVRTYEPSIPVEGHRWRFRQFYYGVVSIDVGTLEVTFSSYERPASFASFEEYRRALADTTSRLAANAEDPRRTRPFRLATTLSRGYDSTALSALAAEGGARSAYTRKRSNSALPSLSAERNSDDGSLAAVVLGLEVIDVPDRPRDPYRAQLETALLAGTPGEREAVFLSMAADLDRYPEPTGLFVGYYGDIAWGLDVSERYLEPDLAPDDISTLSEVRLVAGFVTIPLAFVGWEGIRSIHAISNSSEMGPWRIGSGYDRPIPRRIAEDAGVPRDAFGLRKRAVGGHRGRLAPTHPDLKDTFRPYVTPSQDSYAALHGRVAVLANAVSRRFGVNIFDSEAPAWYRRAGFAVYRAAMGSLKSEYARALAEAEAASPGPGSTRAP